MSQAQVAAKDGGAAAIQDPLAKDRFNVPSSRRVSSTMLTARAQIFRVVVLEGPDAGLSLTVGHPKCTVGTAESADLRLTDEMVDAEHLELSPHPEGVRLRDRGGPRGTWITSLRIQEAVLTQSTVVAIGKTLISIQIETHAATPRASTSARFGDAIADSSIMRELFAKLERVSQEEITVLLRGESGVGKDVLAHAVHQHSARADKPFVTVDCGAISPSLIEAHLFGHERGAFTGAERARDGAFVEAHGGTLFLDEIGELPLDLQPKLLRALENREVRPVGGAPRRFDVRVIAATNRDLTATESFRRDLFYRLAVFNIAVPPLRERRDDILPLARAILHAIRGQARTTFSAEFEARLLAHPWLGNVRELRNVIQRFVVLGADAPDLFSDGTGPSSAVVELDLAHLPYREARALAIERFERAYIPSVLARSNNVVVQAAKHAGVERESFHRMLGRVRDATKSA